MLRREEKNSYSIKTVENALSVLEAFGEVEGEIGITSLSEKLGMEKSYVFRVLCTLEQCGYIEQDEINDKYRLGFSAYRISQTFQLRMGLLKLVKPTMQRLARQCNEAVYLAVHRENRLLLLGKANSRQVVGPVSLVGNCYPLPQTSAGRAIQFCDACIDFGGFGEGTASIAAPLLNRQRKVVASLCIVGPDFRLTDAQLGGEVGRCLLEACEEVSTRLGYLGRYPRDGRIASVPRSPLNCDNRVAGIICPQ